MSKVIVKNISSATVCLSVPELRFSRSLIPGRTIMLTNEEFEELSYDPGMQNLMRAGFIKVTSDEKDAKERIENIVEDVATPLDVEALKKVILDRDVTQFAQLMPTATPAMKDTVVKLAVENNITDPGFTALIKKYCGVDVIQAIALAHQAQE